MLNTAKKRKERKRNLLSRMAVAAQRYEETLAAAPPDKQDGMLAGLDDSWEFIRQKVIKLAGERGEWGGYPLPVEDTELVIEPRHPLYKTLHGASLGEKKPPCDEDDGQRVVNCWVDHRGWSIFVVRDKNGRGRVVVAPKNPEVKRVDLLLETLSASRAWSAAAEFKAMERLKTLVTRAAFRYYLLVGAFMETSPRSEVIYVFRKGRPTIAMSARCGYVKPLAALCLHPIGYYKHTHAGSMVPTDDLIAHLLMMRGDERRFWSKCVQHELKEPESGV